MSLRVVGAGFGRTGTLSLKRALEELGFGPTYHMQEVMRRPSHVAKWLRYARTGEVNWDELFSGFGSGVDFPVSCVWDTLAAHYPHAKVILTVRDPHTWWASTASTIYRMDSMFPRWVTQVVPTTAHWLEMTDALVWDGIFDGRFADRDHAVAVFEQHVAHVRATCPPERLLVFDVAEGWDPLCAFLGVPAPTTPFPRLNDAKTMRRLIGAVRWGTRTIPVVVAAALLGRFVVRRKHGKDVAPPRRYRRFREGLVGGESNLAKLVESMAPGRCLAARVHAAGDSLFVSRRASAGRLDRAPASSGSDVR